MWLFRSAALAERQELSACLSTSNRVNMSALAPKSLDSPAPPVEEVPTKV
jgi:hypothetical protein